MCTLMIVMWDSQQLKRGLLLKGGGCAGWGGVPRRGGRQAARPERILKGLECFQQACSQQVLYIACSVLVGVCCMVDFPRSHRLVLLLVLLLLVCMPGLDCTRAIAFGPLQPRAKLSLIPECRQPGVMISRHQHTHGYRRGYRRGYGL